FRMLTDTGATFTAAPCSMWGATLRAAGRHPDGIDLSSLRTGSLGGEMVEPQVLDRLLDAGRFGLAPTAPGSGYGMAEATMGVTGKRPDERVRIDSVDVGRLAAGRAEPASGGV